MNLLSLPNLAQSQLPRLAFLFTQELEPINALHQTNRYCDDESRSYKGRNEGCEQHKILSQQTMNFSLCSVHC